jgi:hypothetical protein
MTGASPPPAKQRELIMSKSNPRYAVVFRTHFWDEFCDRQLDRLRAQVDSGDIYVLVDQTGGQVSGIPTDEVFPVTDQGILDAGYVAAGGGSLQWYSGDVPLYLFRSAYPDYDYYVQIEYDAVVNVSLDDLIASMARQGADVLGLTNPDIEPIETWYWRSSCLDAYAPEEVRGILICFSAYSRRALERLQSARLEQASEYHRGAIKRWPFCEAYVATEAHRQGLAVHQLTEFGDVERYRWWPPYLEEELPSFSRNSFVHPILDAPKFVPSLFKMHLELRALLNPASWLHRKLRLLGPAAYVKALRANLGKAVALNLRRRRKAKRG